MGFAIPADGLAVVTLNGKVVHSMATQALQLTLPDVPPGEGAPQRVLRLPLGVLTHKTPDE